MGGLEVQFKSQTGHFETLLTLRHINLDALVKSHSLDGTVKSSRCKARKSLGMRRTYKYVGMTKNEAQRI